MKGMTKIIHHEMEDLQITLANIISITRGTNPEIILNILEASTPVGWHLEVGIISNICYKEYKHSIVVIGAIRESTVKKLVIECKDTFCSSPLLYIFKVGKMQKGVFAFTFIIEIA